MKNIATIKGYDFKNREEYMQKRLELAKKGYHVMDNATLQHGYNNEGTYTAWFIKDNL